jgi:hypothetical protein
LERTTLPPNIPRTELDRVKHTASAHLEVTAGEPMPARQASPART